MRQAQTIEELTKALQGMAKALEPNGGNGHLILLQAANTIKLQQRDIQKFFYMFQAANNFISKLWKGEVMRGETPPSHIDCEAATALNELTDKVANMAWEIADREALLQTDTAH